MDIKEQLKNESLGVHNLLTQYIDLHNKFLKSSGTFWSLFRRVNFRRLTGEAYFLFEKLRDVRIKLDKLKNEESNSKEKEFAESLFQYTKALTETVYMLFILLNALKEKAEGGKLSLNEHMENNKKYQQMIKTYQVYGEKLNKNYSSL